MTQRETQTPAVSGGGKGDWVELVLRKPAGESNEFSGELKELALMLALVSARQCHKP